MPENFVRVDNPSTIPVPTYTAAAPTITGTYGYTIPSVAGAVAANNFLTLYNPVGSGKVILPGGVSVSSCATAATGVTSPMLTQRFSGAPTGGVAIDTATDAVRFRTTMPAPVGLVHTTNPTVTLGAVVTATPPPITAGVGGGQFVHQIGSANPPNFGGFFLLPGEGVVIRTTAGDTDQAWNITIFWAEV